MRRSNFSKVNFGASRNKITWNRTHAHETRTRVRFYILTIIYCKIDEQFTKKMR